MSHDSQPPTRRILLHSDARGRIQLHVEGEDSTQECDDLLDAISTARGLSPDGKTLLVAYDALGAVVFQEYV